MNSLEWMHLIQNNAYCLVLENMYFTFSINDHFNNNLLFLALKHEYKFLNIHVHVNFLSM